VTINIIQDLFYIHCVAKTCQFIFCFVSKLVDLSEKKHLTKLCKKCPLYLKFVLALPWEIWSDRFTRQRSTVLKCTFLRISVITTKRLAVVVSKIVRCVVSHIIFTSYARNVCLQYKHKHIDAGVTSQTKPSSINSVI